MFNFLTPRMKNKITCSEVYVMVQYICYVFQMILEKEAKLLLLFLILSMTSFGNDEIISELKGLES